MDWRSPGSDGGGLRSLEGAAKNEIARRIINEVRGISTMCAADAARLPV
jgi:hypothetical protein